jgi:hypothetical protein
LSKSPFVDLTLSDDDTELTEDLPREAIMRTEKHNVAQRRPVAAEEDDDLCPDFNSVVSSGRSNRRNALSFQPGDDDLIPQLPVDIDDAFTETNGVKFPSFLHVPTATQQVGSLVRWIQCYYNRETDIGDHYGPCLGLGAESIAPSRIVRKMTPSTHTTSVTISRYFHSPVGP